MFRWRRVSITVSLFCFLLFGLHCCLVPDFMLTWVSCLCLVFSYFLRPVLQSWDLSYSGLNSGLTLKVVHFLLVTYTVTLQIRDQQVLNQHPSVFWKKYHHCSGKILDICRVGGSKVSHQSQISLCFHGDRQQQMLDLGHSFFPDFFFFFLLAANLTTMSLFYKHPFVLVDLTSSLYLHVVKVYVWVLFL